MGMTERLVRRLIWTQVGSDEVLGGEGTGHGEIKVDRKMTGRKSPPAW